MPIGGYSEVRYREAAARCSTRSSFWARQLDDPREVGLAQLDERPGERAHDDGGVGGVDEQAHPGEHVGALQQADTRRPRGVRDSLREELDDPLPRA
jgi:hypothetical protein